MFEMTITYNSFMEEWDKIGILYPDITDKNTNKDIKPLIEIDKVPKPPTKIRLRK